MDLAKPPPKRFRGQSWQGPNTPTLLLVPEIGSSSHSGKTNFPQTGPRGPNKRKRLGHDTQSVPVDPKPTANASLRYLEYVRRGIILGTPEAGVSQQVLELKSKRPCPFSYV